MKTFDVLILDDNSIIANKIKSKLFQINSEYKYVSNIIIRPHYLMIDNNNTVDAAHAVNEILKKYAIQYLLLDRGFGKIIESSELTESDDEVEALYKDNNIKGYYIEDLLIELKKLNHKAVDQLKGVIIYTYDNYADEHKEGEVVKEEIVDKLYEILPQTCSVDVLLTYTSIYKIAGLALYEGYSGNGIVRIGKKNDFILYGIFAGELLYHKLVQMISANVFKVFKAERAGVYYRLLIYYGIFITINIGANVLSAYITGTGSILIAVITILFGLILIFTIISLKPSLLFDIKDIKLTKVNHPEDFE